LLGKDSWEESFATESGALKLRHALVNLLVTVLGCPDNNHLWMLLFDPSAMVQSCLAKHAGNSIKRKPP